MLRLLAVLLFAAIGCTDTEYAPGYSESDWDSIRVGDAASTVLGKLGHPFDVRDLGGGVQGWIYSRSPSSTHYSYREIHMRGGVVSDIDAHFYFD